jgi:signal transduction histidine kinase
VVQEVLCNSRRHSGSDQARLAGSLDPASGKVSINISDGGLGTEASRLGNGQGIATMKARAERLRGNLRIHNDGRNGVDINLEFPVDAEY